MVRARWAGPGPGAEPGPLRNAACASLQHLYVWLVSEKAHERQRAVRSCAALLRFLNDNLYLHVSARLAGPTPQSPSVVPAKPPSLPRLPRFGVQGPRGPCRQDGVDP